MSTAEQWAPIPDAPGYEVSDLGRVRGIDRVVHYRDGRTFRYQGQLLRPAINPVSGYPHVRLKGRSRNVHTLVLEAFVGPRPSGMECRHLNGVPGDNRLSNLRWGTSSENNQDQVAHGTHPNSSKEVCLRGHALVTPNLTPRGVELGIRVCLACDRAQSTWRKALVNHSLVLDLDEVANRKYRYIMRGALGSAVPVRTTAFIAPERTWVLIPIVTRKERAAHAVSGRMSGSTVCGRRAGDGLETVDAWAGVRQCSNCVRFITNGAGWS